MSEKPETSAAIDPDLLEILACPLGKTPVKLEGDYLVCTQCGLRYPIRDGIPVMLIDEAELPAGVSSIEETICWKQSETP
ncbi:MAG TPA: Trm112 family protein [Acidobacteriota bacterium]